MKTTTQQPDDKQVTKPKPTAVSAVKDKTAVPCAQSYILSWTTLSYSGSREHLALFEWSSWCILDFHFRGSHHECKRQITLG